MSDMVDTLAKLDVIEPLTLAAYQVASGGGWTRLEFLRNAGWSGYEVEKELKRFSIPIHGRGFTKKTKEYPGGTLFCYVKREQARWAEYVLRRARVQVVSVIDVRNEEWADGHDGPVPAWSGRASRMGTAKRRGNFVEPATTKVEPKRGVLGRLLDWLGW